MARAEPAVQRVDLRGRARRVGGVPIETPQKTVLVVDDAPENAQLLGAVLGKHHRVLSATSGARALELAAGQPRPDLILLDIEMPGLDGYAVLDRLRADARTRDIPVIFVTAMDTETDELRGLERGAVDYVTKPIRPGIVVARVRTHLALRQARDDLQNQNALLEAEVARRMAENVLIQDASIRSLGRLAEVRDPETGNHLLRTQSYVRLLGEHLRALPRFARALTSDTIDVIVKSAPLHDIGKVGIPDHILLKPGRLTSDEWTVMQTHAKLGAEAIEIAKRDEAHPLAFLSVAKEIAHWHHEKWDGSGYPDRLAGDAIPVSARLMALADVFDALLSRRPYKEPMAAERAIEIIVEGRGTHFDPDVVDAFLAQRQTFVAIARTHMDSDEALLAKLSSLPSPAS